MGWFYDFWSKLVIGEGNFVDFTEVEDAYNCSMAIFCVICAGLAAGLTMGLLSLDVTKLEIKSITGNELERYSALVVLPLVKQHHLLLVTLLLFNSLANETLPIFLGALVPNYIAVIISVTLVLVFGEIIPSALFTGPQQLITAARMAKLVYFLLFIFYPISFPISKILDYAFGTDDNAGSISRNELEALVILQGHDYQGITRQDSFSFTALPSRDSFDESSGKLKNDGYPSPSQNRNNKLLNAASINASTQIETAAQVKEGLTKYEVNIMTGILKLSKMAIIDCMIPIKHVFSISSSTRLDERSLYDILDSGFSRIPVYKKHDKEHFMGYLLVKQLIVISPTDGIMVENLTLREPLFVKPSLGLLEMLNIFQEGQCHIALISKDPVLSLQSFRRGIRPVGNGIVMGIVTLEDIIEKIIQDDIIDETDTYHPKIFPNGGAPTVMFHNITNGSKRMPRSKSIKSRRKFDGSMRRNKSYSVSKSVSNPSNNIIVYSPSRETQHDSSNNSSNFNGVLEEKSLLVDNLMYDDSNQSFSPLYQGNNYIKEMNDNYDRSDEEFFSDKESTSYWSSGDRHHDTLHTVDNNDNPDLLYENGIQFSPLKAVGNIFRYPIKGESRTVNERESLLSTGSRASYTVTADQSAHFNL
eukprot:gene11531-15446_t